MGHGIVLEYGASGIHVANSHGSGMYTIRSPQTPNVFVPRKPTTAGPALPKHFFYTLKPGSSTNASPCPIVE